MKTKFIRKGKSITELMDDGKRKTKTFASIAEAKKKVTLFKCKKMARWAGGY